VGQSMENKDEREVGIDEERGNKEWGFIIL
jgi:hypothetical protein